MILKIAIKRIENNMQKNLKFVIYLHMYIFIQRYAIIVENFCSQVAGEKSSYFSKCDH